MYSKVKEAFDVPYVAPIGLLIVFVLVFITFAWIITASPAAKSNHHVVILGPSGAGKSALYSKLVLGHTIPTHTSTTENIGLLAPKGKQQPLSLVDVPGHPRLRSRSLAKFVPTATAFIFVVDSAQGLTARTVKETVDNLHILLALSALSKPAKRRKLLIYLNKEDQLSASIRSNPAAFVDRSKSVLAREMERRRLAAVQPGAHTSKLEALGSITSKKSTRELPTDEAELMQVDIWSESGPWEWTDQHCPFEVDWVWSDVHTQPIDTTSASVSKWLSQI